MPFDEETGLDLPRPDVHAPERVARLRELGLYDTPDQGFDALATKLAQDGANLAGIEYAPYAMVNFRTDRHQFFAGLHVPSESQPADGDGVSRVMDLEHGYCPEVVGRGKALVLDDVCAHPRFESNEVVDLIGIRSYLGDVVHDPRSGLVLGTACIVDTERRMWGRAGLKLIKDAVSQIEQRVWELGR
ncbi:GAF domain-containing protein [Cryptosporangium sp. NPDC051539]|uniref:GAF domain-containing protein n=1 Tax=Cryptosporangium sp. NPDC051539 TaxID=3363962 RepID=UPI00379E08E3